MENKEKQSFINTKQKTICGEKAFSVMLIMMCGICLPCFHTIAHRVRSFWAKIERQIEILIIIVSAENQ